MYLKTGKMEFRGVQQKTSKNGKPYNMGNFEEYNTGEHCAIYLGDNFQEVCNAKKGDLFILLFEFNKQYKELKLVKAECVK